MREDPKAREHLNAIKRNLASRFRRDSQRIYDAFWKFIDQGTTKDDDPRVRLLMKLMDKILADQREFQPIGDAGGGVGTLELHIHSPEGMEIKRGTAAAREEAIEVQFRRREEEERTGNGKAGENRTDVQGTP